MTPSRAEVDAWRAQAFAGTSYFGAQLAQLDDAQLHEPCLLPGWTRAHLVTHVARNADALVNLLEWARTGVETPMYASREQRDVDIDAGAGRPGGAIRDDHDEASARLGQAMERLPTGAWSAEVRTASGRLIPASEVPWMRVREVWVHAVDLGVGGTFADLPAVVGDALLDEALALAVSKKGCPDLRVACRESGQEWMLGDAAATRDTVVGSRVQLLGWVLGRDAPVVGGVAWPRLPGWL